MGSLWDYREMVQQQRTKDPELLYHNEVINSGSELFLLSFLDCAARL